MKVAVVNPYDSESVKSWSGTPYHICYWLQKLGCEIEFHDQYVLKPSDFWITKLKHYVYCLKLKKSYLQELEPSYLKDSARRASYSLSESNADFVLTLTSFSGAGYLKCKQPVVIWGDSTFDNLVDFYPYLSNLCGDTIRSGNALEQSLAKTAKLQCYSSEWAANSAIEKYGARKEQVFVVPFGSNLSKSLAPESVESTISSRSTNILRILFIGAEWGRKGGDICLNTVRSLMSMGIPCELHIVGAQPEDDYRDMSDSVHYEGFLDKNRDDHVIRLVELLQRCHVLLVPSLAEAYGICFAEASSFAMPSVATNVGGIGEVVKENKNGFLLPAGSAPDAYANCIKALFENRERYHNICLSSYREYSERLNWENCTKLFLKTVQTALD